MESSPNLPLSPPTSPATPTAAAAAVTHRRKNPRKKKPKLFHLQLQQDAPSSSSPAIRKPPAGKRDPSAPTITMPCSECGRKFWSWKALYGHMRCHPDRRWRGVNPPPHFRRLSPSSAPETTLTAEDSEAASCLLLLANSSGFPFNGDLNSENNQLAGVTTWPVDSPENVVGHRCGVCLKVFSTGQALGGHKRCHWEKNAGGGGGEPPELNGGDGGGCGAGLDLNFPAEPDEIFAGDLQLVLRLGL